jgi:hypothetical protein
MTWTLADFRHAMGHMVRIVSVDPTSGKELSARIGGPVGFQLSDAAEEQFGVVWDFDRHERFAVSPDSVTRLNVLSQSYTLPFKAFCSFILCMSARRKVQLTYWGEGQARTCTAACLDLESAKPAMQESDDGYGGQYVFLDFDASGGSNVFRIPQLNLLHLEELSETFEPAAYGLAGKKWQKVRDW